MADVIVVTPQPLLITTGPTTIAQDIRTALDISNWDFLDLQVGLLSAGTSGTVVVNMFTSMQNLVDDSSWMSGGINCGSASFTLPTDIGKWKGLVLPASSSLLLRFLRYQIVLTTTTSASIMISGMGRKR
ncbi:MAG: hypothetical protein Q8Q09_09675 [Deltaproteobacteria bacterium]|nr:hypothetical protein [Deltaproteobacteria bacterium]